MAISQTADDLMRSAFKTYFELLEDPLPGYKRFLYAVLGSLSLFSSSILILDRPLQDVEQFLRLVLIGPDTDPSLTVLILAGIIIYSAIYIMPSVFFGFLISMAETKHGPVRLYLSGVLLPAFVVSIIRATWAIDIASKSGNGN